MKTAILHWNGCFKHLRAAFCFRIASEGPQAKSGIAKQQESY